MLRLTIVIVVLAGLASGQWAWGHGEDFEVGVAPATNQIRIEFDPDLYPWGLPPSDDPLLPGFALDDPGFVSLEASEAEPNVFMPLNPAAIIKLQVLAVSSPEFKAWDPLGPGEDGFQIAGSRLWRLGSPFFDTHCWWQIDTSDPAYDPSHGPWAVTFQLLDASGAYLPSDPVTVTFTPEPATAGLVALLAVLRGGRRTFA